MATILTKKKDTTGAPVAGDLTNSTGGAELAVNTADKRLYTKDSGGNVVEVGTNPGAAVTFTAGTVSAPAITTTGDTNTGIFFPAADTIAFAEGGAEAMRIDSDGDVGIGITAPTQKLDVGGLVRSFVSGGSTRFISTDGTVEARFGTFTTPLGYVGTESNHPFAFYTNGTEKARIDSSGNVGIGTSSPTASRQLHVAGTGIIKVSTSSLTNGADFGYLAGTNDVSLYVLNRENGPMLLATNNTERARITSGGYFKASNSGAYGSATATYHELRQTDTNDIVVMTATSGSYASTALYCSVNRAATSSYEFYRAVSGAPDTEFILRGDGNGYADGTWNNNGADYAEFFESANGQALTLGATVVLDGNKVREATAQDPASAIIGVVRPKEPSKASMVVGNTAWNKWANKYLTDDFDRYIMEDHDVVEWEEQVLEKEAVEAVVDEEGNEVSPAQEAVYKTKSHSYESHNIPEGVTVPADAVRKTHDDKGNKFQHYKLNPAWDKDAEYTPREQRPEWNIIGLVGQVKVLKGHPTNDRWVKMRDVSATVEEWFIR